jgi:mannose-6-phosphate isomerase-like protein (cupin superfamily)
MIDKTIAKHYRWGQNCDGWHLVQSDSLSVIQEMMPPHAAEVRHKHSQSRQFFYILSGEATFEIDGEKKFLRSEQGIEIAPGAVHQVLNTSNSELHFLVISSPPSHGDRIDV